MRKVVLTMAGLAALVTTSVAVANGIDGAKTAKAVAATFSATAGTTSSRTCTTTDGKTITVTNGKYTGTALGDADLAGAITLRVRSVVNTTDKVGVVNGEFRIDTTGRDTFGAFSSVYDNGAIAGYTRAGAHEPGARILGNLSATFDPATGFTGGKIGGGTSGGSAVELGRGSCNPAKDHPEHSAARGSISALSTASITVAGLTCMLPAVQAGDINAKFKTGDNVEIRCAFANGLNTLTRIEKRGH
jgi:Cu/Ag efflux protein CusF